MTINSNAWHYRVCAFTYFKSYVPKRVNFCTYWRRVFLYAPPLAIVAGIVLLVGLPALFTCWLTAYVIITPIKLMFGKVPKRGFVGEFAAFFFKNEGDQDSEIWGYRYYKPFRLGAFEFYPSRVMGLIGLFLVLWTGKRFGVKMIWPLLPTMPQTVTRHPWSIGMSLVTIVFLVLVLILRRSGKIRDSIRLTKEFLKAKKQKICPLIEFVDGNPPAIVTADRLQTT